MCQRGWVASHAVTRRCLWERPRSPDENDGTAHVTREMAEKAQHLRAPDVYPRVQRQGEGELATPGRYD